MSMHVVVFFKAFTVPLDIPYVTIMITMVAIMIIIFMIIIAMFRVLAHPSNNLTFRWVFSKGEERVDIEQVIIMMVKMVIIMIMMKMKMMHVSNDKYDYGGGFGGWVAIKTC